MSPVVTKKTERTVLCLGPPHSGKSVFSYVLFKFLRELKNKACLMEMYRYLIDDFLIQYSKSLGKKDFTMKKEDFSRKRKGQREYLKKALAKDFMNRLNSFFESKVEIPRIKHGKRQEIESLLNEEALVLARYLRSEKKEWAPRLPSL